VPKRIVQLNGNLAWPFGAQVPGHGRLRYSIARKGQTDEPDHLRIAAPDHDDGRDRLHHPRRGPGSRADADRHLPRPEHADHLRRPAVRWPGPAADGRLHHQLLRVPLPLHHRHRARRKQEHPGRRPDEAPVPSRHEHGPGDGRDGQLRQPGPVVHAAQYGPAVRHAVRRGESPGRLSRLREQDAQHRRDSGRSSLSSATHVREPARRVGPAAFRRQSADHRPQGRSQTAAIVRSLSRRRGQRHRERQQDHSFRQPQHSTAWHRSCP